MQVFNREKEAEYEKTVLHSGDGCNAHNGVIGVYKCTDKRRNEYAAERNSR